MYFSATRYALYFYVLLNIPYQYIQEKKYNIFDSLCYNKI